MVAATGYNPHLRTRSVPRKNCMMTFLLMWCSAPLIKYAEALDTALFSRCRGNQNRSGQRSVRPLPVLDRQVYVYRKISSPHRLAQYNVNTCARCTCVLSARGGESSPESFKRTIDDENPTFHRQKSPAFTVPTYFLIWSPGVWRKVAASLFALVLFRLVYPGQGVALPASFLSKFTQDQHSGFNWNLPSLLQSLLNLLVLPMLSSACCGIQLLINALVGASGCAGFNKYLGPVRPFFLSLLLYSTLSSFPTSGTRESFQRWIVRTMVSFLIALLPAMTQVHNDRVARQWVTRQDAKTNTKGKNDTSRHANALRATVSLDVPSMGCVACINKIDSSIRQCAPEQVLESKSWLESSEAGKGGKSVIKLSASSESEAQHLAESLVEAVRGAGFDTCTLDTLEVEVTCS